MQVLFSLFEGKIVKVYYYNFSTHYWCIRTGCLRDWDRNQDLDQEEWVVIRTFHTAPEQGQGRMGYVRILRSCVLLISEWLSDVLGPCPGLGDSQCEYIIYNCWSGKFWIRHSMNLHLVIIFAQYNIGAVPLGKVFTDHHSWYALNKLLGVGVDYLSCHTHRRRYEGIQYQQTSKV